MKTKLFTLFVALVATTTLWASNVITYTATDRSTGYYAFLEEGSTILGPTIVSHTFANGIGTITCDGEITKIGDWAFGYCSGLTSVTIPNSVTTIGDEAFYYCKGLTSVTIPNSVTSIGDYAFYGCSGLTSIDVDAANTHYCSIDGVLFNYAKDTLIQYPIGNTRTEYMIPNSVTTIGVQAFSGCSGLTSVTIPNSVTTIGNSAFSGCSGLTSITIPNSVTTIGRYTFYGCTGLNLVTIPNSVTTIEYRAFVGCSGLTSVTIGNSVTSIGDEAFAGCKNIRKITCFAKNPPICGTSVFSSLSQYTKAYVLASSLEDYQFANVWRDLNLYPIESEVVPLSGDQPVVTPTDQDVTITWPITDGTDTYTLTITKNGEIVCVLTFNANGQLINIAFAAPGHNGAHQAPAATLTAQGYQFTVTGLNPGTTYNYNVTATDAGGKTIAEHKGDFSTTGGTGLNTLPYEGKDGKGSKYFHNGNLIIERNNTTYTLMGQKVR